VPDQDPATREDLLDRVRARIDASAAGEAAAVVAPEAQAEADMLLGFLEVPGGVDPDVLYAAGLLHWNRWVALGADGSTSADLAQLLLTPLYLLNRPGIPESLAEHLAAHRSPPEAGPAGLLNDLGVAFAGLASALDRPGIDGEAAGFLEKAVEVAGPDDPNRWSYLTTLGGIRARLYEAGGSGDDLDRAVAALREACRAPLTGPELVPLRCALAGVLAAAAWQTEDPAPLREAVDSARNALREMTPDDRDDVLAVAVVLIAAGAGRAHADAAVDAAFIEEVVHAARRALAESAPEDPLHPVRLAHLGLALEHVGEPGATDEAVRLLCAALPRLSADQDARSAAVSALRNRLLLDRVSPLDDEALRLAVEAAEQVAAASSPDDPDHVVCLAALAAARQAVSTRAPGDADAARRAGAAARAMAAAAPGGDRLLRVLDGTEARRDSPGRLDHAEDRALFEDGMAILRRSIAAVPVNRAMLPLWLADLATMLRQWCDWRPDPERLDEAIAVHRRLLGMLPAPDHQRAIGLANLLVKRSELAGHDREGLAEAVALLEGAVVAADVDAATRAIARHYQSVALLEIAKADRAEEAARQAVTAARAVVDSGEPADAMHTSWHNLAAALTVHHEATGRGLAEAIAAARQAVALGEGLDGQGERIALLAQLLATAGDVDEAAPLARRALAEGGPAERQASTLNAFGQVMRMHHARFGGAAELDESIAHLRAAVEGRADPVARGSDLAALASALRTRYSNSGDLATLDEAIAAGRRATHDLPAGHRLWMTARANLATALTTHHQRSGESATLAEAIEIIRAIVAATPDNHAALPIRLANLARALGQEFARTGDPSVLDEVIRLQRRAITLAPATDPNRAMLLSNLAMSLVNRRAAAGRLRDDAAEVARAAVAATPPDHPARSNRLLGLATALATPWGLIRRPREIARTAAAAARIPSAPASVRLTAYQLWGQVAAARGRWDSAAEAFTEGVRLLPRVAPRNLTRMDAEFHLADVDGLHVDAAACAVRTGDVEGAVSALEQGRGILLSYALDSRTELTDLHAAAPDLAETVERLVRELDAVGDPLPEADDGRAAVLDHRHALSAQWENLVAEVRQLPGFERFGEPPSTRELLPAAADGPVVMVNVSRYRCDALVVTTGGVRAVPLRRLRAADVQARAGAFLEALDQIGSGDLVARMDGQAAVRDTLAWLWDVVAGPVLDALGHRHGPPAGAAWPRVWWCPTGMLAFLPLHAAGHHDGSGRAVLDRVVSSYTPTVRALLHARARPPATNPGLVAVAMSQTPGEHALPATVAEARALAARPGHAVELVDDAARFDAVVAALARCGWAHFACHAVSDPLSPSESRLLLHDRPLAVRHISRLRLRDAELAFLSACSTARGNEKLADEAIHIASAFQLAGYRHVIATLWPVLDSTAARVAEDFYERHRNGNGPAEALHEVVRGVRAAQPLLPSTWAAHVHSGP
jgi:tetratricopeptide (TPR) repeat protein